MIYAEQRQAAYIVSERHRYLELDALRARLMPAPPPRWRREPLEYQIAANAIGLHPQRAEEISARFRELDGMAADLMSGEWLAQQASLD